MTDKKTKDEIIAECFHFRGAGGLQSSVINYAEYGKPSGSLLKAIKDAMEEYAQQGVPTDIDKILDAVFKWINSKNPGTSVNDLREFVIKNVPFGPPPDAPEEEEQLIRQLRNKQEAVDREVVEKVWAVFFCGPEHSELKGLFHSKDSAIKEMHMAAEEENKQTHAGYEPETDPYWKSHNKYLREQWTLKFNEKEQVYRNQLESISVTELNIRP